MDLKDKIKAFEDKKIMEQKVQLQKLVKRSSWEELRNGSGFLGAEGPFCAEGCQEFPPAFLR